MFKEKFPTSPIKSEKEISPKEKEVEKKEVETVDLGIEIPEEERKFNKEFVSEEEEVLEIKKEEPSRLKKLAKEVLCSITAGVILLTGAIKTYAESPSAFQEIKPKKEVVEVMESKLSAEQQKKLAFQALENLVSIPEKNQSRYAQIRVAQVDYLPKFAKQVGKPMQRAINILYENMASFFDQKFGNKDGKVSLEEYYKFRDIISKNGGLMALVTMFGNVHFEDYTGSRIDKQEKQLSSELLNRLLEVSDRTEAREIIKQTALRREAVKIGFPEIEIDKKTPLKVSPESVKKVLEDVNLNLYDFAKEKFGDKALDFMTNKEKKFPGFQELRKMSQEYFKAEK